MWNYQTVSVIFPTYAEQDSIYNVICDFSNSGYVDEIVVVNNNAQEGTDEAVRKTHAVLVHEKKQGYGFAIQRGFREAKGDILVIAEPDGTFEGRDIVKLLSYSDDFPVVFGTRTTRELIWRGANMGFFLKWGNWTVAKMMEFLFNTTILTDMGCTLKLFKREALTRIWDKFTVGTSHFGCELMLLTIAHRVRFIEIPVNYKERVCISSVTGSWRKTTLVGLQMIYLILKYRIRMLIHSG